MTLTMRRLRNFIGLLNTARVAAESRRDVPTNWRRIRAASFYMAAHFGALVLDTGGITADNCVTTTLEQMAQHFEGVYKAEAKKDRTDRRQDYLTKLHQYSGVNSTTKAVMRGSTGAVRVKDAAGNVKTQYHEILADAAKEWARYYDTPPANATDHSGLNMILVRSHQHEYRRLSITCLVGRQLGQTAGAMKSLNCYLHWL